MKKFSAFMLTFVMLLCGATCGESREPTETPAPSAAPTESTAPTGEPASGSDITHTLAPGEKPEDVKTDDTTEYPLLVSDGGTVYADLDGDGKQEKICLASAKEGRDAWLFGSFEINGHDYADEIYTLGYSGYDPDPDYYAITDIDPEDGCLEIAIQDLGPSDDFSTGFFRYDGESLSFLGTVEGVIRYGGQDGSVKFTEPGVIQSQLRLSVFQTWWATASWRLADGKLTLEEKELYGNEYPNEITALADFDAYSAQDASLTPETMKAGTKLIVLGTDNSEWVLTEGEDRAQVWLYIPQGYYICSGGEYKYCWEVFDGLIMAD